MQLWWQFGKLFVVEGGVDEGVSALQNEDVFFEKRGGCTVYRCADPFDSVTFEGSFFDRMVEPLCDKWWWWTG